MSRSRVTPQGGTALDAAMRHALDLAGRGPVRGPNPRVGCVLLDAAGTVVAEGWHRGAGTPHAEAAAVAAARAAGVPTAGTTAVVTLEPCAHLGRTPPCADLLLAAGVARVVIGTEDPNPAAAGGAARLRAGGVPVVTGVLAAECESLNRRWLHAVRTGRPHVTWKFAATLDGRSAAADGTSRWVTGPQARRDVHRRRAGSDAVLVGTGTVLADDPALTARPEPADRTDGGTPQPLRVVMGLRDLPPGARVRATLDGAPPALHLRTRDPHQVLAELARREVRSLWLEGGPRVAAAFWRAGLVDEVLAYLAPALLGAGPHAVGDLGVTTIADAVRLTPVGVTALGDDVLVTAVPDRRAAGRGTGAAVEDDRPESEAS